MESKMISREASESRFAEKSKACDVNLNGPRHHHQ